eukprot:COSAG02_NODE_3392_length_6820_cov_6.539652_8_plen_210_part_00
MLLNERLSVDSCVPLWVDVDIMRQIGLSTINAMSKPGIEGVCLAMGIVAVATVDELVQECGFAGEASQKAKDTALKLVVRCADSAMHGLQHHSAQLLLELGAAPNHVVEHTPTSSHGRGIDRDTWGAQTRYLMADAIDKASVDTIRCLIACGGSECLRLVWRKDDSYFDGGAEVDPGERLSALQWARRCCIQEQRRAAVLALLQSESLG